MINLAYIFYQLNLNIVFFTKMVVIDKIESTELFDDYIVDTYMYEDTLYILYSLYNGEYEVYTYKLGMPLKFILEFTDKTNGQPALFRHNINGPPGLTCVYMCGATNVAIMHDIFDDTPVALSNLSKINPFEYKCYDRTLLNVNYATNEFTIYNIDTHKKTIHVTDEIDMHSSMLHGDKIYFVYNSMKKQLMKVSSLKINDDEIITECVFDMSTYPCDYHSHFRPLHMLLFKVDDIIYCINKYIGETFCLDIKKKVQHKRNTITEYADNLMFNKRGTKLYGYRIGSIHEFSIIKGTLFKSRNNLAYNDMTITTVSMDE